MGMSIDTVDKWLKIQRTQRCNKLMLSDFNLTGDKRIESLDTAISYLEDYQELLRKYQKIEKIVEHWACCGYPSDSMIAIKEVIEDE